MLHAGHQIQRLGHGAGGGRCHRGSPHLGKEALGDIQVAGFRGRFFAVRRAGRFDVGRHRTGGAGGGSRVDQSIGRAGEDGGLHRGRKERVADALAHLAQALVGAGLAHRHADDHPDHGAQHTGPEPAGGDGDPGGGNHGGGRQCADGDVGRDLEYAAKNIGHHRGMGQRVTQAGSPERVRHGGSARQVVHHQVKSGAEYE